MSALIYALDDDACRDDSVAEAKSIMDRIDYLEMLERRGIKDPKEKK